jgi:hypothetical protein
MLSRVNISLDGISLSVIILFLAIQDSEFLGINKLPLLVLILTFLITTPGAAFFLFFFLLVGIDVSASYNYFSAPNPCLGFVAKVRTQIARDSGFVLYKIDRLVIVISSPCQASPLERAQEPELFFLANCIDTGSKS